MKLVVTCIALFLHVVASQQNTDGEITSNHYNILVKAIGACAIFILTMLSSVIPRIIIIIGNKTLFSLANAFGAGVFLAAAFLFMLPGVNTIAEGAPKSAYPSGMVVVMCGYLLMLLIDKVLLFRNHAHTLEESSSSSSSESVEAMNSTEELQPIEDSQESSLISEAYSPTDEQTHFSDNVETCDKRAMLSPLILLSMLSVHSLFEGILLGLQPTKDTALAILIAILAHKWVESLSLGISMVKQGLHKLPFFVLGAIFAAVTPLGVMIGSIASKNISYRVVNTFNAIAAGTFLYIGTTEILAQEFMDDHLSKRQRWIKFVVVIVGSALLGTVRIWARDEV